MAIVGKSILGKDLDNSYTRNPFKHQIILFFVNAEAKWRYKRNPSERYTIWYGRVQAYWDRILRAIDIWTDGIERFPDSYRLYRHRGHRYLSLHRLKEAYADFKKSAELFESYGTAEEMEEDGIAKRLPIPPERTGFNIYYHLALAAYLCDDLEAALEANTKCFGYCINDEDLVANSDWGYLILRRLGRKAEAEELIEKVPNDLKIKDNIGYYKRILFYKGLNSYEDMQIIDPKMADDYHKPMAKISQLYGVAAYYIAEGEKEKARVILEDCLADNRHFGAFAHLACEHDLKALNEGRL